MREELNVEELFASKVFTLGKMKERLPKSTYKEVKKIMDQGGELSLATADVVDRKSTRLNSSHNNQSRMPSSA